MKKMSDFRVGYMFLFSASCCTLVREIRDDLTSSKYLTESIQKRGVLYGASMVTSTSPSMPPSQSALDRRASTSKNRLLNLAFEDFSRTHEAQEDLQEPKSVPADVFKQGYVAANRVKLYRRRPLHASGPLSLMAQHSRPLIKRKLTFSLDCLYPNIFSLYNMIPINSMQCSGTRYIDGHGTATR